MKFLKSIEREDIWFIFNGILFILNLSFAFYFGVFSENYAKATYYLGFSILFYLFNMEENIVHKIKSTGRLRPISVTLRDQDSEAVAKHVADALARDHRR